MSKRRLLGAAASAATLLFLTLVSCSTEPQPAIQEGQDVPATSGKVVNLAQGWSEEQQQSFWFDSQGSRIIPMDWFLALEQAANTQPFRANANLERFGFLLEHPSPANPDGLPVGFARDTDASTKQAWVGWTCAACHTNQIHYQGTAMRIDGAPTLADVWSFLAELEQAMQKTAGDSAKFDRFAVKVLGSSYTPSQSEALRLDFLQGLTLLSSLLKGSAPPHPYGHGRVDAFGIIFNRVLATNLDLPSNYRPADAPVSYPFLWDAPYSDVVQWNGSISNKGIGSVVRNTGEVIGVFATVSVDPARQLRGYRSSVQVEDLGKLEEKLRSLQSPLWPSTLLPAIDTRLATKGGEIYQNQCASCHTLIDRTSPHREFTAVLTSVSDLRTDPTMADNFMRRSGQTGRLQGHKVYIVAGETFGPVATGQEVLGNQVLGTVLHQTLETGDAAIRDHVPVLKATTSAPRSYKARPLNGIWATAPYLHNGSVPNLWELLQPEKERSRRFAVGSREFDPVRVGYRTDVQPGGFVFDTILPGNSNAGHDYGTTLSESEKWALLEYLKTL